MSRSRRWVVMVALVTAILLNACAAPRATLNTPASACFRGLPAALDAVHHHGTMVGVRRVNGQRLRRKFAGSVPPQRNLCLFAFRGPFAAGAVDKETQQRAGRFAIVVVSAKDWTEVRSFVTDRLSIRFRHKI